MYFEDKFNKEIQFLARLQPTGGETTLGQFDTEAFWKQSVVNPNNKKERPGIVKVIPKGTPAGTIANIACVGIENILQQQEGVGYGIVALVDAGLVTVVHVAQIRLGVNQVEVLV